MTYRKGDGVLLSAKASAGYLQARDRDGRQIQIHGVVHELGKTHLQVRVMVEIYRGCVGVLALIPISELEPADGVLIWNQQNARQQDIKRRNLDPSPYWAPL